MAHNLVVGLLVLFSVAAHSVARGDDGRAREWLARMSEASRTLNYSGTFVYQHNGNLEAMQIVHATEDGGERERLLSLSGPKREVLRDNQVVTCILGDRKEVVVNRSRPRTPFPVSFPRELAEIEKHYRFDVLDEDRVAGLVCRVVAVEPRDHYRYGRRLCVHDESHLLLRSELTGPKGEAIEQIMFTSVTFPEKISSRELRPDLSDAGFAWKREPEAQPEVSSAEDSRWQIMELPDGFMLTDHGWHQLSEANSGVEHWVYSDGLASVSLYIEKAMQAHEAYSGVTRRGGLNAYGTMVDGHFVTVVGEVPSRTVEMIGKSVRLK
ncbi:MucB/RseB C-terminal domain-containing protein [Thiogranum longum]